MLLVQPTHSVEQTDLQVRHFAKAMVYIRIIQHIHVTILEQYHLYAQTQHQLNCKCLVLETRHAQTEHVQIKQLFAVPTHSAEQTHMLAHHSASREMFIKITYHILAIILEHQAHTVQTVQLHSYKQLALETKLAQMELV